MRATVRAFLFCLIVAAWATGQPHQDAAPASVPTGASPAGVPLWIKANGLRIKTKVYSSAKLSRDPVLIVVLHGDLPSPSYHYRFAQAAALKMDDVVVAALLRPGYFDNAGDHSDGEQGLTTGDNYTPEVVDAVAQTIEQLKNKFHPVRTVLVGHSGGAAITGNLLGRWPAEIDGALMVACPCDLVAWRKHMQNTRHNPIWSEPVKSLSPIDLAAKLPHTVHVSLLVGKEDPVTPVELSKHYADTLRKNGDDVTLTVVPGLEHNILLEPVVFDGLATLVDSLRKDAPR